MARFLALAAALAVHGHADPAPWAPMWATVCTRGDASSKYRFCDKTRSFDQRATDLVSLLTPEEKQSILGNTAAAVPRLGIPAYQWWSEGLHGAREPCVMDPNDRHSWKCPTSFPAPSAMAAALNDSLYLSVGRAIGVEGRAINNLREHNNDVGNGLTYWAPNANMERDPRWGRNQEAPGEDPHLTSRYTVQYVRGLQEGEDPRYVQLAATCKHFVANSLEHSKGVTRHDFDAKIPVPELVDYYLPAFKSCVQEAKALGIMCSYNAVNGVPMCANGELLTNVLRKQWGFDGYVTSDCGAINDIWAKHRYVRNATVATAEGLKAGCDTDCGDNYNENMVRAVNSKMLSLDDVDVALRRLVKIQMRLGLFDPKEDQIYFNRERYGILQVDTPGNQKLALEAALQSIVLLKNEGRGLPLKRGRRLALIGPHIEAQGALLSNYHGSRCIRPGWSCITSPLQAITAANAGGQVVATKGVNVQDAFDNISGAVEVAKAAETVILLMGIDGTIEGEERDRYNATLPGLQAQLVEAIMALRKPTVMVLIHGGAITLGPLKDAVPTIVDAFYGGEMGSEALAAVLFGDYNPSGKLPVTMYPLEFLHENPITQMSVTKPPGRTHLYYTGQPEFAFGTGLSYSDWMFEWIHASHQSISTDADDDIVFQVRIKNLGPMAGRQRVLAYARQPFEAARPTAPLQRLWAYEAVELQVNDHADLTFALSPAMLASSDELGNRVLSAGHYEIVFSDGERQSRAALQVSGPTVVREAIFAPSGGSGRAAGAAAVVV